MLARSRKIEPRVEEKLLTENTSDDSVFARAKLEAESIFKDENKIGTRAPKEENVFSDMLKPCRPEGPRREKINKLRQQDK